MFFWFWRMFVIRKRYFRSYLLSFYFVYFLESVFVLWFLCFWGFLRSLGLSQFGIEQIWRLLKFLLNFWSQFQNLIISERLTFVGLFGDILALLLTFLLNFFNFLFFRFILLAFLLLFLAHAHYLNKLSFSADFFISKFLDNKFA